MSDIMIGQLLGGYRGVGSAEIPLLSTPGAVFTSIPTTARLAIFTIRSGTLTLTFDGTSPIAGVHGVDYPAGTYTIVMKSNQLATVLGAGTATGSIQYLSGV